MQSLFGFGPAFEFVVEVVKCAAQPFFDDRVIERHVEHLRDGQSLLDRPGQQMAYVLGGRSEHFRLP